MNLVNEPTQGSAAQGLRFRSSPLFLFSNLSLLSKRNFRETLLLISSLEIFRPWRRRLGERRPSPLPATSASSRYSAPAPSLSLCCARRSTSNPNKTICIRIWIQLQYIELPTNLDPYCFLNISGMVGCLTSLILWFQLILGNTKVVLLRLIDFCDY